MRYLKTGSSRWLAGIAALVIVLIVVSVTVSLVRHNGEKLLPPDTVEGTVQRYLLALTENRPEDAYSYVSDSLKDSCTLQVFLQTTTYQRDQDFGARVTGSHILKTGFLVDVEITEFNNGSIFNQGEYSYSVQFTLNSEGGEWKMSEPPWPMSYCPPERETPVPVPVTPTPLAMSALDEGVA